MPIEFGIGGTEPIHREHVHEVFHAHVDDPHLGANADHADDTEHGDRERPERIREPGGLADEGEADESSGDQGEEHVDARESTSFWVVVRDARRLQCSVASNWARTDGAGGGGCASAGSSPLGVPGSAGFSVMSHCPAARSRLLVPRIRH